MSKAADAGKSFLAGVLAKLPEAVRGQAQTIFESADATQALEVIGTGALAQPEINRQMDDLRKQRESLDGLRESNETWYAENKAALEEYLQIKPEYERLKVNPDHKPAPVAGLSKEEIAAQLEARDRAFAGAMSLGMDLSSKHMHLFNEPLNMTELLSDPKLGINGYGLQDAYNSKHGERVQTKAKEAEDARINKMVEEKLAEERRKLPQQHPFPLRDSSPSPLDALNNTERKTTDYTVDSAIAEYDRLSQTRSGSPA